MQKLSIGIPCLNAGRFLTEAVQSIFAQSFQDWELLIVDDGSTDDSFRSLGAITDRRVRLFSDGAHRGLAARLNQIVRLSRGKYIGRMDADDLVHPDVAATIDAESGGPILLCAPSASLGGEAAVGTQSATGSRIVGEGQNHTGC